jgi:hypothetical protein
MQLMQDRLLNFIFFKFVFVFGVLNTQYFDELILWSIWYMAVALVYTLSLVAHNRYKYVIMNYITIHINNTDCRINTRQYTCTAYKDRDTHVTMLCVLVDTTRNCNRCNTYG